jgi:hypothetical protein
MFAKPWGRVLFAAATGITLYWPIVCLVTVVDARDAAGWSITDERPYWVVLPLIAIWGAWGLWALMKESQQTHTEATAEAVLGAASEASDA